MAYKLHNELSGAELHVAKLHAPTHKKSGTDIINIDELGKILAPTDGVDGSVLYWNKTTQQFEYKVVVAGMFWQAASEGVSATTSTVYQEKLKLDFTILVAGIYRVHWAAEVSEDVKLGNIIVRCQINDTNTINEQEHGINDTVLLGKYIIVGGFIVETFTAAAHFVDIDFKSLTGGSVNIRRARILVTKL